MQVKIITHRYNKHCRYSLKIMTGYRKNQAVECCMFNSKSQALEWCQTIGYEVIE